MKPVKIEPSDVRITFEASASDLRKILKVLASVKGVARRLMDQQEDASSLEAFRAVYEEHVPLLENILKHPLVEEYGDGA